MYFLCISLKTKRILLSCKLSFLLWKIPCAMALAPNDHGTGKPGSSNWIFFRRSRDEALPIRARVLAAIRLYEGPC